MSHHLTCYAEIKGKRLKVSPYYLHFESSSFISAEVQG
jgi:hypothetical protein